MADLDYRPPKKAPNQVCITVGGNLIKYPFELTTRTADLTTSRILWNSVISTPGTNLRRLVSTTSTSTHLLTSMNTYTWQLDSSPNPSSINAIYKPRWRMDMSTSTAYKKHHYIVGIFTLPTIYQLLYCTFLSTDYPPISSVIMRTNFVYIHRNSILNITTI